VTLPTGPGLSGSRVVATHQRLRCHSLASRQRATVGHAGVACWQAAQVPGVEEPLPGHHSAGPHFLDAPDLGWSTARRASKYQVATKGPVSPSRTSARVAPDRPPAPMNRAPARAAAAARPRMQASGWRRPRAARRAGTAASRPGSGRQARASVPVMRQGGPHDPGRSCLHPTIRRYPTNQTDSQNAGALGLHETSLEVDAAGAAPMLGGLATQATAS
jgi:hypothetical protein